MKKTLRLIFSAVLVLALVLSNFVFAHAVSVGTEAEFVSALSDGATEITITSDFDFTQAITLANSVTINATGRTIALTGKTSGGEVFVISGPGDFVFNGGTWTNATGGDLIYPNANFTEGTIKLTGGAHFTTNAPINLSSNASGLLVIDDATIISSKIAIKNQGSTAVQLLSGTVSTTASDSAVYTTTGGNKGTLTVGKPDGTGPTIKRDNAEGSSPLIYLNAGIEDLNHTFYGGTYLNEGTGPIFNFVKKANIAISGGNFIAADNNFITDSAACTIAITGGTYNVDPTAYVDTNAYTVTESSGAWTVAQKQGGGSTEPQTVKVTFNANGGTCATTSLEVDSNGKLANLPEATRDNYTFDGWFTAAEGGVEITTDTVFDANTTVYAQWTVNQDTNLTFAEAIAAAKSGDTITVKGTHSDPSVTLTIDKSLTINCEAGSLLEYKQIIINGDIDVVFNNINFSSTKNDAFLPKGASRITFNGGKIVTTSSGCDAILVDGSHTGTITVEDAVLEGHYTGFNSKKNCTGTYTITNTTLKGGTHGIKLRDGQLTLGQGVNITVGSESAIAVEESANAKLIINGGTYTSTGITPIVIKNGSVKVNGGTFNVPSGSSTFVMYTNATTPIEITGGNFTQVDIAPFVIGNSCTPPDPVVKGGTFAFDPTAYIDTNAYEAVEESGKWTVGAIRLITPVEITFNGNGGTASVATLTTDNKGRLATLPTATRVGYVFEGWFDAQTGGNQITTATVFETATTVYAKWIECDHSESDVKPNCQEHKTCTVCNASMPLKHDFAWHQNSEQTQHWYACEVCGKADDQGNDPVLENHTTVGGSVATCIEPAVCGICNLSFVSTDPAVHVKAEPYAYKDNKDGATHAKVHNCDNTLADAKEKHTYDTDGYCECGAYKAYAFKTVEETKQIIAMGEEITFTSVADFAKFVAVKVDGSVLVKGTDYTVVSGSTKVTLKADFVKTLTVGTHKIEIISTDGTATTTFGLEIPEGQEPSQGGATTPDAGTTTPSTGNSGTTTTPSTGNSGTTTTPDAGSAGTNTGSNNVGTSDKTGDFTNILLLVALFVVSSLGITTAAFYGKAKKVK